MNAAESPRVAPIAVAAAGRAEGDASGSRRRGTDAPSRLDVVRNAQVAAVGTAFLRARPIVVAPVVVANGALLAASGAPVAQRVALAIGFIAALALFVTERHLLRRRVVSQAWLAGSLVATLVLLAAGALLSGALASPVLPLVLAPAVVGAAAFGRTRTTLAMFGLAIALVVTLALVPDGTPWAAIPRPWSLAMTVCAFAGLLALSYAGVAGLVDAHARVAEIVERMRIAAIDEAAARMRATEQVGAKVAHELKNPLAGIKALIQLVRGGELTAKADERLGVALGEVDRMDGIVRDYLAFARPIADLDTGPLEPGAIARDVADVLGGRAEVAGVSLVVDAAPVTIIADARRLREAIYNLVDNALAATPAGGRVAIRVGGLPDGGAEIAIEDTGAGIDLAIADAAAPFVTTKEGGTGLGLAIARAAIHQHGGTLAFARREPAGTRAVIRLPAEPGGRLGGAG